MGHPVGMDYRAYSLTLPAEYRAAEAFDYAIELVDGRVSCVSCHRIASEQPPRLQLANSAGSGWRECLSTTDLNTGPDGSGLCLACHIK